MTTIPFNESYTERFFVKKSYAKRVHKQTIRNQQNLDALLKKEQVLTNNPDLAGKTGFLEYQDNRSRVSIYSFLQGQTLKEKLAEKNTDKVALLQRVIDDYVDFSNFLNTPEHKKALHFKKTFSKPKKFFKDNYSSNKEVLMVFQHDIGSDIERQMTEVVHADPHPENIMVNGSIAYIDWETASSNGYFSFDLQKILKKTNITFEEEVSLVEYAIERKTRSSASFSEQREAYFQHRKTYFQNRIMQTLCASNRYLKAAASEENEHEKEKLMTMAKVLFTDANTWIDAFTYQYSALGASAELGKVIRNNAPSMNGLTLSVLSPEDYLVAKETYNPDNLMSQENMTASETLIDKYKKLGEGLDLGTLLKDEHKGKMLRKAKAVATIGALALLVGGSALLYQGELAKESKELALSMEYESRSYQGGFAFPIKRIVSQGYAGEKPEPASYEFIDSIAKAHGFTYPFIYNIMDANLIFSNFKSSTSDSETNDITFLDPYDENMYEYDYDQKTNISHGIVRLENFFKNVKTKEDTINALVDFYHPVTYNLVDLSDKRFELVGDQMASLVLTVLKGHHFAFDAGYGSIWLQQRYDEGYDEVRKVIDERK